MSWNYGTYGFLNYDIIAEEILCINDLGLELRQNEIYDFNNADRDYSGYLFQYTLEGEGIYETPKERIFLSKGDAFFITFPDNSRYYLPKGQQTKNWTYFYIHFSGPSVKPFFKRISELKGPVFSLELDSPPIQHFFNLYDSLQKDNRLSSYKGSDWLFHFLILLLRYFESPSLQTRKPMVYAARNWIKNNFKKPVNLESMAIELNVSFSHLSRQFHKELGITPIGYLTHLRLEYGINLLINTTKTISEISAECGFDSPNYFTKVFKKTLHTTPTNYRKIHKF